MSTGKISGVGDSVGKSLDKQQQSFDKTIGKEQEKDGSKFEALLNEDGIKQEKNLNVGGNDLQFKASPKNAGDKVLDAFIGMKDNIESQHKDVNKLLGGKDFMSMKDMISTQKAITKLAMTEDLIAKIVGKATQNIDTLMKQQ